MDNDLGPLQEDWPNGPKWSAKIQEKCTKISLGSRLRLIYERSEQDQDYTPTDYGENDGSFMNLILCLCGC